MPYSHNTHRLAALNLRRPTIIQEIGVLESEIKGYRV